jgi:hypothetical protein
MIADIGLVACSKLKVEDRVAAQDLYNSPLFKMSRRYVEERVHRWFILSAEHELLHPKTITRADLQAGDYGALVADTALAARCNDCETLADGRKSGPPIALRVDQAQLNPSYDVLKRCAHASRPFDSVLNQSTQPIAT